MTNLLPLSGTVELAGLSLRALKSLSGSWLQRVSTIGTGPVLSLKRPKALAACVLALPLLANAAPVQSLKERREAGVVIQKYETSCAAAALATVLTYGFGKPVSEQFLAARMLARTDPQRVRALGGFSLLDLKRVTQSLGLEGAAYRDLTLDDLQYLHAPIVPVMTMGFRHYVVVNKVTAEKVLLADPAFGNRAINREAFAKQWRNGMAFVVTAKS